MTEDKIKNIQDELSQAGTDPALLARLRSDRITAKKQLPPMDFLMRLFDVPSCPRGELVAFTGKAKSGKTFVVSMLMAAAVAPQVLAFSRNCVEPLRVLWIDTEQSDQSTQDILRNRLMPMAGTGFTEDLFDIFNIRVESWQDRLPLVLAAVDLSDPDLVVLDGIRDLVDDINDGRLAHEVVETLMRVAQARHCCIVSVIHQNKAADDKTLRGSIGSELTNKAFEVYECEKLMPSRTFTMMQKHTRKYDIEQVLYYTVDERGLPQLAGEERQKGGGQEDTDLKTLFRRAFSGQQRLSGSTLRSNVMGMLGISSFAAYNKLLARAIGEGVLKKKTEQRHVWYTLVAPA